MVRTLVAGRDGPAESRAVAGRATRDTRVEPVHVRTVGGHAFRPLPAVAGAPRGPGGFRVPVGPGAGR